MYNLFNERYSTVGINLTSFDEQYHHDFGRIVQSWAIISLRRVTLPTTLRRQEESEGFRLYDYYEYNDDSIVPYSSHMLDKRYIVELFNMVLKLHANDSSTTSGDDRCLRAYYVLVGSHFTNENC